MRRYDVVYILKQNIPAPNELRYSLRSIEANMTHGDVWFVGGQPKGITPDKRLPMVQKGRNKWERARSSLIAICKNEEISQRFWLFNDDFYVMKRMLSTKPYFAGLLRDHIIRIESRRNSRPSMYSNALRECERQLKRAGLTTFDYALHIPMLIDKTLMLEALDAFPYCPMFRSIYGNYAKIGGTQHPDVKVKSPEQEIDPELDFMSTSNKSFGGTAKALLAERFPEPCRYETDG